MNLYQVLRRPVITEKSTASQAYGKYALEVEDKANKAQVTQAVENAFKVKVTAVNIMTVPGKRRRLGRRMLAAHPWKKAVVTLKEGDKIELFEST